MKKTILSILYCATLFYPEYVLSDFEKNNRPKGYRYLMYSDPMYIRYSDGSETKLQVLAFARRHHDRLHLVVDDKVVGKGYVSYDHLKYTFKHKIDDLSIRVRCLALIAEDSTYNHSCKVVTGKKEIGVLDVIKRIYPD